MVELLCIGHATRATGGGCEQKGASKSKMGEKNPQIFAGEQFIWLWINTY